MKRIKVLVVILGLLTITSCEKEESNEQKQTLNYEKLTIISESENQFGLYFDFDESYSQLRNGTTLVEIKEVPFSSMMKIWTLENKQIKLLFIWHNDTVGIIPSFDEPNQMIERTIFLTETEIKIK